MGLAKGTAGPILAAGVPLLLASAATVHGQTPASIALASAHICHPVTLQKPVDLNFGAVVATQTPGLVLLARNGARTARGGAVLGSAAAVSAASFRVAGEPNSTFSLCLPSSIRISSGSRWMLVEGFTAGSPAQRLDATGGLVVDVGATLEVGANQAAGSYSGSFTLTVAYN